MKDLFDNQYISIKKSIMKGSNVIGKKTKERQHIIESIDHWQKHIVDMFDEGYTIKTDSISEDLFWVKEELGMLIQYVKVVSRYCSLCINYADDYNSECDSCHRCPWFLYSGKDCCEYGQEFNNFLEKLTKESAEKVIEKLWKIGTNV